MLSAQRHRISGHRRVGGIRDQDAVAQRVEDRVVADDHPGGLMDFDPVLSDQADGVTGNGGVSSFGQGDPAARRQVDFVAGKVGVRAVQHFGAVATRVSSKVSLAAWPSEMSRPLLR